MEEESTNNKSSSLNRNIQANVSFKDQKKDYNFKKRYFTKNIQSAIDSTQEVHSGWLKARISFKRWTKVWCQVKPGYLILYTSQEAQKKHRLGVVLLSVCQIIKRPTKKEGFCFKLINPFNCSVWAKSSTKALAFSHASLTLRASDESIGKFWLGALHRCHLSSQLDGYQPIADDVYDNELLSNRSTITDSDDDGDDEQTTREFENITINHSNNISLASSSIHNNNNNNNNCQLLLSRPPTSSTPNDHVKSSKLFFTNGNALQNNQTNSGTPYKRGNNDNNSVNIKNDRMLDSLSSQLGKSNKFYLKNNNNNLNLQNFNNANDNNQKTPTAATNELESKRGKVIPSSGLSASRMVAKFSKYNWTELQLENVRYIVNGLEEFGNVGAQSEDVHEGNKSILWHIIKQLRPGMDLSKVTLPAFILEPRSFLEKLADYYYHCDILTEAVSIDDPLLRLINIVKWYLSGFYKKPKGSKKPYNPILGEKFRCFWDQPKTQSRTFFVAEQVSHHPPISAFHVSNRKDGYTITCAILSRSKFGGNSVSAIFDGKAHLNLTKRNETYTLSLPYANCRGILLGSLCLELGGKVEIACRETNCKCELDFKLAPVWANSNSYNAISGKILKANKVTHTLDGHWDKKIHIVDSKTNEKSVLWEVNDSVRNSRLKRYTVDLQDQGERESVKLWAKVSEALSSNDYVAATTEKTALEDMQRQEARERKTAHQPEHFVQDTDKGEWRYKWQDDRLWNEGRDIMQFEDNFKVKTLILNGPSSLGSSNMKNDSLSIDPTIDLPVTQINSLSNQTDESKRKESKHITNDRRRQTSEDNTLGLRLNHEGLPLDSEKLKCFESNFNLMNQAIKKVAEANKKLEVEVATLKSGKKTAAFIIAAVIVILLSWYLKF